MESPARVSVHGGHSGQFCNHAENTLEEMLSAYIEKGYSWVGITEHMPPVSDLFLYPDEIQAGFNTETLTDRFDQYMKTCRHLQRAYADRIQIHVAFETEYYSGSLDHAKRLVRRYSPDYVVGSIHHVNDIPFDFSPQRYGEAIETCGGKDELYAAYFDMQDEMIRTLKPRVVGHMDIVRIHDPDYRTRMVKPEIWKRILRNLERVKALDLILDFNLRPLSRGEEEPYLSEPILRQACDMGIAIVPGDDSHKVADIGAHLDRAIDLLLQAGGDTHWRLPVDRGYSFLP